MLDTFRKKRTWVEEDGLLPSDPFCILKTALELLILDTMIPLQSLYHRPFHENLLRYIMGN